jgi:hypothetical protein
MAIVTLETGKETVKTALDSCFGRMEIAMKAIGKMTFEMVQTLNIPMPMEVYFEENTAPMKEMALGFSFGLTGIYLVFFEPFPPMSPSSVTPLVVLLMAQAAAANKDSIIAGSIAGGALLFLVLAICIALYCRRTTIAVPKRQAPLMTGLARSDQEEL